MLDSKRGRQPSRCDNSSAQEIGIVEYIDLVFGRGFC